MKNKYWSLIPVAFVLTLSSCVNFTPTESKSLYIASQPDKTEYYVGDSFTLEGIKIIDSDSGETITTYTSSISEGYLFKPSDTNIKSVTISKKSYNSTSFNITVRDLPVLTIISYPKQTYLVGDYFTLEGLVVKCNDEVITGYTCNFTVGNRLTTIGTFTVLISKEGYKPASYNIEVNPAHALNIDTLPNKTTYEEGDNFDTTGLVVKDELNNVVTDYTISPENGAQLKYKGTTTVTVSKENYADATFEITVNEKSGGETTYRDLKIYYINDTHGSFIRNTELSEGGMSYISKYIKDQVNEDPDNAIVLSGGDMFQGGYESNETHGKIMIEAMNEIGFDAMVLGNHEFDWGESYIYSFDELLDCPILSSNTFYEYDRVSRPTWLSPYTVITRDDLKIGIIGSVQENIGTSITGSISDDFYFPAPNEYIKEFSTYLRTNESCDIIIAAMHDEGFDGYSGTPTKFSDLVEVDSSTGCKYVDAMFFAHDHNRKNGDYNGVPYLEAGCNGKNIGVMTLNLKGNGVVYTVEDSSTSILWSTSVAKNSDPAIEAIAAKPEYADIIAHADDVIYTFNESYTKEQFTYVVCMAMYWYVNSHKSQFDNQTVYFASHNTGGIRAEVSSGNFTRRDLVKVIPFDNLLSMQTCKASHIANMEGSSYYRTYKPTEPVYDDGGCTKAISITYITEYKYAYYYQVSYVNYSITAKTALIEYLLSGVNPNL